MKRIHRGLAKVKGAGYILWQSRHMAYHVMLGLLWAWFLRERWGEFNPKWIWTAVVGSLLPDVDHLNYFFRHGRNDAYTQQVISYIKHRQWRTLFYFLAIGHKFNTSLSYHNVYTVGFFMVLAAGASLIDWQVGVVLFGAMILHYLFDMVDDVVVLGAINPNWKRWGNGRQIKIKF